MRSTIAPEQFIPEPTSISGLRSIYWQLARAESDDGLRDVVARLWAMAVCLEDGNVSDAEKALAGGAGRVARGAGARRLRRRDQEADGPASRGARQVHAGAGRGAAQAIRRVARPLDPNRAQLRSQDLRSMLDRMERLARSGAKDAAQADARSAPADARQPADGAARPSSRATTTTCSRRSTNSAT